jgi:uncharacterized membrane protein
VTNDEETKKRWKRLTLFDWLAGTRWLGRPLHPLLTYLPLGAWMTGNALDLIGPAKGADRAILLGTATACPAMLTGCVDLTFTEGDERRISINHMLWMCVAAPLYSASLVARRKGRRRLGVCLAGAGFVTAVWGSWLGTDLVVEHGMGVNAEGQGVTTSDGDQAGTDAGGQVAVPPS